MTKNDITIREIEYDSNEYKQELSLRNRVLRIPLGLDLFNEDLGSEPENIHIGAFVGMDLAGCLLLVRENETTLKMRQVAVDDEYRGMGIGTMMVRYAEGYAIQNGFLKITMHARKTAVDFYRKLGYNTRGDEFTEVLVPHYIMEKLILNGSRLSIIKVNDENLLEFAAILKEAAYWMISQGFRNWDPDSFSIEAMKEKNNLDELFICCLDGQPAGTIKLQEIDEMFWPDAREGEALYVHKLAVRRKYADMGISRYMLDWAKEQTKLRGRKYLRLDCIADRKKLAGFYEGEGFVRVDEKRVLQHFMSARYEYRV
ncbi:MAG TPA: GNAT family N-acetyltransferase [Clostridia bacterium]|nr:GNAT family N-acetyltransferase [Clostridia bacterium]HPQ46891.1 GNAT family N-acetyltransferase [Clostridia bacterium]HRX42375.1 GNAT family N-acetyltransferase [Clostridia bacterium]